MTGDATARDVFTTHGVSIPVISDPWRNYINKYKLYNSSMLGPRAALRWGLGGVEPWQRYGGRGGGDTWILREDGYRASLVPICHL